MLYVVCVMEYRLSVIFRCLLVLAVGVGCMTVIANGMQETDGDGIIIAFFMLCLYAGVVCGAMGKMTAFAMMLGIRDLGCFGMVVWAVLVTLLSFIIIPILLTWHVSALILSLLGSSFRLPWLRKVMCVLLAGGLFGGIAVYVNNTVNQTNRTTKTTEINRHYVTNEHHYHIDRAEEDGSDDSNGYTALHKAVLEDDFRKVQSLINSGVEVNARDHDGNTPLHLAARFGYTKCALTLLKSGKADKSLTNNQGKTALELAQGNGHTACERAIRYSHLYDGSEEDGASVERRLRTRWDLDL